MQTCGPVATLQHHCCLQIWVAEPSSREDMQSLVMSYLEGTGPRPPVDSLVRLLHSCQGCSGEHSHALQPMAGVCVATIRNQAVLHMWDCWASNSLRGAVEFQPGPCWA